MFNKSEKLLFKIILVICFLAFVRSDGPKAKAKLENIFSIKTIEINNAKAKEIEPTKTKIEPIFTIKDNEPTKEDIINEIKRVFGENARVALAIAEGESQFNPKIEGDKHLICAPNIKKFCDRDGKKYGNSFGVFQIRYMPDSLSPSEALDYKKNIAHAKKMFDARGWKPWTVYTSGQYKNNLHKY